VDYSKEAGEEGEELCEVTGVDEGRISRRGRFFFQYEPHLDFPHSLGMDGAEKR
jgi:hypothetical protein